MPDFIKWPWNINKDSSHLISVIGGSRYSKNLLVQIFSYRFNYLVSSLSNSAAILDNIDGKEEQEEHDDLQVCWKQTNLLLFQQNTKTLSRRKYIPMKGKHALSQ